MNRQGPPNQNPMRLPGFPPAATAASRGGGMPNGKIGGGWQGGPPPGVPNPAGSRPGSSLPFSQLASQPGTPLDLSEFPALGGQPQNTNVQPWNRISTQSPSSQNRPPQPNDLFPDMDGYRIGGNGGGGGSQGQAQGRQQMQPNSLDDFPALPRTAQGGDHLDERGFMGMGAMGAGGQYGSTRQANMGVAGRNGLGMGNAPPQSRLLDVMQQPGGVTMSDVEKKNLMKVNTSSMVPNGAPGLPTNAATTNLSQPLPPQTNASPAPGLQNPIGHSLGQQQPPPQQQSKFSSNANGVDFGEGSVGTGTTSNMMGETDRFGLGGLLNLIRGESGDFSMLALGQDLTQLGLDLNQPEAPLYPSFASPWADTDSKPVEPDFQLPSCYTVHNVQPLGSKVAAFSDETLFYIFYTMPRDVMQEVVATELSSRNWRYHTALKLWLTKDTASDIRQVSETAEKGIYVFFDPNQWERVRKEYVLDYNFLDHRVAPIMIGGAGL